MVLYLELLIIMYIRYQNVKDPAIRFRAIWYKSISKLAVLNVYTPVDTTMDENDRLAQPGVLLSMTVVRLKCTRCAA